MVYCIWGNMFYSYNIDEDPYKKSILEEKLLFWELIFWQVF